METTLQRSMLQSWTIHRLNQILAAISDTQLKSEYGIVSKNEMTKTVTTCSELPLILKSFIAFLKIPGAILDSLTVSFITCPYQK